MNTPRDIDDQLAQVWHRLQVAHINFESARPGTKDYVQRWEDLIEAMRGYNRVVQQMAPEKREKAGGD